MSKKRMVSLGLKSYGWFVLAKKSIFIRVPLQAAILSLIKRLQNLHKKLLKSFSQLNGWIKVTLGKEDPIAFKCVKGVKAIWNKKCFKVMKGNGTDNKCAYNQVNL